MSTITQPTRAPAPSLSHPREPTAVTAEQRIVIRGLDWDLYDRLSNAIDEKQHVFLAYDGKDLEIMTKGRAHEDFREFFGRFVNAVTFELRVPCRGAGETTWKRPEIARGLEADLCYYFDPDKRAADAQSRARKAKSIADYPNPDLAIEIDISPSQIDRPGIYAALRVAELWRFDGESLAIEQLGPDGKYVPAESSRFLPVRADEVFRWVAEEDSNDEVAWELRLREWARRELARRLKA
ncbi:MAG: Uma2 family endonuclease [Isosphaerales bacterium]